MTFTMKWLRAALIRAVRTAAQVALGMFTVGLGFKEVDWMNILSVAAVSAIYSIITSIATKLPELETPSPQEAEGALIVEDVNSDAPFVAVNLGGQHLEDVVKKKQVLLDVVTDPNKVSDETESFEV